MVKGLDVFRDYFTGHAEQFVLIGGTAAALAMEDAGLAFRASMSLLLTSAYLSGRSGVTIDWDRLLAKLV
jgi:hypothetical protein